MSNELTTTINSGAEILVDDRYREWTEVSTPCRVWVSGYAEREGRFLSGQSLATDLASHDWTPEYLDSLNGCWAGIRRQENRIELVVDRSRSIPVFYYLNGGQLHVSNVESEIRRLVQLELNPTNSLEFLLSTFVTAGQTLFDNLFHVQPGEKVTLTRLDGSWKKSCENYFHYFPKAPSGESDDIAARTLLRQVDASFETLSKQFTGKRPLLPISGGLDSRLIAYYLKKHGIQDVVCYTYGSPKNPQNQLAESVARGLGFEWIFIPYDRDVWSHAFQSQEVQNYWDYACNGVSSPHMQDFPALLALSKKFDGLSEFVLLPGHVGDAWASEFIVQDLQEPYPHGPAKYHSKLFELRESPVLSAIIYRYYNLWPTAKSDWEKPHYREILDRIEGQLSRFEQESSADPRFQLTEWVLRARTAQWITNACRSAEFFGADFALPLGDYRLIDVFRKLSVDQLYRRRLYSSTMSDFLSRTEFEALNSLKVMSGVRPQVAWKKFTIGLLKSLGFYKFLDRFRRLMREDISLNSDAWFTSGKAPELTSISTALSRYSLQENLPAHLYDVVRRFESKMSHSIECNGLLAAAILSRYCSQSLGPTPEDPSVNR